MKRKVKATKKKATEVIIPANSTHKFNNREIGWLHFNDRVLHEAEDSRNPLLERIRFLGICYSNLDEFFMKRVAGIKRQMAFGIRAKSADGSTNEQQMASIRRKVSEMVQDQCNVFNRVLKNELEKNNIHLVRWQELKEDEIDQVRNYYKKSVFPVLTPLSVDPGHPFPFISNLSTSLGVTLRHPDFEEKLFARVKVPKVLPQWIRIEGTDSKTYKFVSLLEVMKENLQDLFPSMQVLSVMPFRITRSADTARDEDDAEDLIELIEEELRQRRFAEVVRLEHGPKPDPWMLKFLIEELELTDDDLYELEEEIDLIELNQIADLNIPQLKFDPWVPRVPPIFAEETNSIFSILRRQDVLVHHPYESFSATVEKFINQAVDDQYVLAIKMTLYRTGDNSPIVKSLIRAAEEGKQVVCLIELKARFDEERNIYWAQALENAGVHVVYGVVGFKTHAKTALVVRKDSDMIRCYAHIGTGNYNASTAKFYTDVGLLTSRESVTQEIVELFNYLTGHSLKKDYKHLLIAPINMSQRFKAMIEREAEHGAAKRPAQIMAKFNSMEESDISQSLYEASQKGVQIDLMVRGFCCLKAQVPGLSDNIRVTSIIGRFLEHSRIFYFRNGKTNPLEGDFFIGSADWMYRNFYGRVECIVPIYDLAIKEKLWEILQISLNDQRQAWDMTAKGDYKQRKSDESAVGSQQQLMQLNKQRTIEVEEEPRHEEE